jgi:hypothetical protein
MNGLASLRSSFEAHNIDKSLLLKVQFMKEDEIKEHFPDYDTMKAKNVPWNTPVGQWHDLVWTHADKIGTEDHKRKLDECVTRPFWVIDGWHRSVIRSTNPRARQCTGVSAYLMCSAAVCFRPAVPLRRTSLVTWR